MLGKDVTGKYVTGVEGSDKGEGRLGRRRQKGQQVVHSKGQRRRSTEETEVVPLRRRKEGHTERSRTKYGPNIECVTIK